MRQREAASRADLNIWLSHADPPDVQHVIREYVASLGMERMRDIAQASRLWPRYYRERLLFTEGCENLEAARGALLSLLSTNVRALDLLPQRERRQFLKLCGLEPYGQEAIAGAPEPPSEFKPALPRLLLAAVALLIVGCVAVTAFAFHNFEGARTAIVNQPRPHTVRVPRRVAKAHATHVRRISRVKRRLQPQGRRRIATSARTAKHARRSSLFANAAPRRARRRKPVAHRRAQVSVEAPPQSVVAGLYSAANPDANIQSVVIVRDSPEAVIADVTSREYTATIVDQLTLVPRGNSLQLIATERLTNGAPRAHACFVGGSWRSC